MQACNTYKTSGVKVDLSNCDTFFFISCKARITILFKTFILDLQDQLLTFFKWCLKYKHETLWHVSLRATVLQWPSLLWVTCLKRLWALSLMLIHKFAKSQVMVHWHGLCWPSYREPHNLMFLLVQKGTIVGLLLTYHQYLLLLMEKDPHLKLFIGVSKFLESLLEDHLLLANGIDIHRCSEYKARFFKNTVPSSKKC